MQAVAVAAVRESWPRSGQCALAVIAGLAAVATQFSPAESSVDVLMLPLAVLAIRFFELARFKLVHRSGWLLVYSVWSMLGAALSAKWDGPWRWSLSFLIATFVLGAALFVQQRQEQFAMLRANEQRPDQDGEDWALGGLLALVFVLLLVSVLEMAGAGISMWGWASGLLALPLLWLQLVRSPRFPVLAGLWLLANVAVDIGLLVAGPKNNAVLLSDVGIFSALWLYLTVAKRVHRTFPARVAA
jgi:hypothetical protein